MKFLVIFVCSIICIELFIGLGSLKYIKNIQLLAQKVIKTLRSESISDHWKQKALLIYAGKMFLNSSFLFFLMICSILPILFVIFLMEFFGSNILSDLMSLKILIISTFLALIYIYLRSFLISDEEKYGPISQVLHSLMLSNKNIAEASFEIEGHIFEKKLATIEEGNHVFISGLARSGTTLLTNLLYNSGEFCSLSYRDMPFVLAPNLWRKMTVTSKKYMTPEERAHADGLLIDFDSPEALEEVFWRVFCGNDYIRSKHLHLMTADKEITNRFRRYIKHILYCYSSSRYLSKNNNNILRLGTIGEAFPNALILIPFRDPISHSKSLANQHALFCNKQKKSNFTRKYMRWLVHHEFGLDHKPFALPGHSTFKGKKGSANYYLFQWIQAYTFLLHQYKKHELNISFFCYEHLCNNPQNAWKNIQKKAPLKTMKIPNIEIRKIDARPLSLNSFDTVFIKKAYSLYEKLEFLSDVYTTNELRRG